MVAGLPGTGIGGLFYLISALVMPIAAAFRDRRKAGARRRWRVALAQFSLAAGILAALGVTGLALEYFTAFSARMAQAFWPGQDAAEPVSLGIAPTLITFSVLILFLFGIELVGAALSGIQAFRTRREHRPVGRSRVIAEKLHVSEDPGR